MRALARVARARTVGRERETESEAAQKEGAEFRGDGRKTV
jgi:hypothetical protein